MSTQKHYFVEQTQDDRFAVRAKGSKRASDILPTQKAAIERAAQLNPNDRPDVAACAQNQRRRPVTSGVRSSSCISDHPSRTRAFIATSCGLFQRAPSTPPPS